MEKYIEQLIKDLEDAMVNLPEVPYYEIPPHMENVPEIAELAQVPYKRLSEWTGIDIDAFPPSVDYPHMDLLQQVLDKMMALLEAYHIEIVDIPKGIPREDLYDAIALNWDIYVQYLPSTGFDLELCQGDPGTCYYGDYCDCSGDEECSGEGPPEDLNENNF